MNNSYFAAVPLEILELIVSNAELHDIVLRLPLVSRLFHRACLSDPVWQRLLLRECPEAPIGPPPHIREQFVQSLPAGPMRCGTWVLLCTRGSATTIYNTKMAAV